MAIITFYSNGKEQNGKTLSMVATSTYMAIEHNYRILLISTSENEETLYNCFFERSKKKKSFSMVAGGIGHYAIETGMSGLVKMAKSNKVSPEMINNYTKPVFKETLEVLFSGTTGSHSELEKYYPEIILAANSYYDYVFVDLDSNIDEELQTKILKLSNLIVDNTNQKLSSINDLVEERTNSELLSSAKSIVLIGRYDKDSKYSVKNIARYMGLKRMPLAIPYNTLFYDAAEEAKVPNFFLSFMKNKNLDKDDKNYVFMTEVKRAQETIQYVIQELQLR